MLWDDSSDEVMGDWSQLHRRGNKDDWSSSDAENWKDWQDRDDWTKEDWKAWHDSKRGWWGGCSWLINRYYYLAWVQITPVALSLLKMLIGFFTHSVYKETSTAVADNDDEKKDWSDDDWRKKCTGSSTW